MSKSQTSHSVVVDVPVRTAYNQWTQFEEFPKFMKGVEEVKQRGPNRVFWRVTVAGRTVEYEADIVAQIPDQRIAWRSVSGKETGGVVDFESLGPDRTRVTLEMTYEPEGVLENIGDLVGLVAMRTRDDLENFKKHMESRGVESGGWRGEI
ncbi:MAG: SRPBCC family protein [Myxococcota bacterium]